MEAWEVQITANRAEALLRDAVMHVQKKDWRKVVNIADKLSLTCARARQRLKEMKEPDPSVLPPLRRLTIAWAAVEALSGAGSIRACIAEANLALIDCRYAMPTHGTLKGIAARCAYYASLATQIASAQGTNEDLDKYAKFIEAEESFLNTAHSRLIQNKGDVLWEALREEIEATRRIVEQAGELVVKLMSSGSSKE